jgi:SAM-dependent methyltransferase
VDEVTQLVSRSFYERHNRFQCDYFEGPPKKTMVPAASPYLERHIDEALACAGAAPGERVLEVGCGMGRYTIPLAARGVRVEGLDLSPVLIDRLREYGGDALKIPLHVGDVMRPPRELEDAFDVVLGFFMLHHVHDLRASFAGLAGLVKPGGRLVFVEPNPFNPLYYVQVALTPGMKWRAERGLTRMRRDVIFDACHRAGLDACELSRFGFFPPTVANLPAGRAVERVLERVPIWRAALPFQLFKAHRP